MTNEERLKELAELIRYKGPVPKAGPELIEAKALVGHGAWLQWLKENFKWTPRTAQNIMRAAAAFDPNAKFAGSFSHSVSKRSRTRALVVSRLPPTRILWAQGARERVNDSAFYLLSRAIVPHAVRRAIVERANGGEWITREDVVHALAEANGTKRLPPTAEEQRAELLKDTGESLGSTLAQIVLDLDWFRDDRREDRRLNFHGLAEQIAKSGEVAEFRANLKRVKRELGVLDRLLRKKNGTS